MQTYGRQSEGITQEGITPSPERSSKVASAESVLENLNACVESRAPKVDPGHANLATSGRGELTKDQACSKWPKRIPPTCVEIP